MTTTSANSSASASQKPQDTVIGLKAATRRLAAAANRLDARTLDVAAAQGALARIGELEVVVSRLGLPPRRRRAGS